MSEIIRIDMEQARYNPQETFATPKDVVDSVALTRGQKIAALEAWRESVEQRLAATSEGMPAVEGRECDVAEIENIDRALTSLLMQIPEI